jgi:hypothetical protein
MRQSTRFFLIMAMIFSIGSNAQFLKGTRIVGVSAGSAFFNAGNSDQTVTSIGDVAIKVTGYGISLTPTMGWFLSENTAVGFSDLINPSGDQTSFEENGSTFQKDKARNLSAGLGAFVRNYFSKSGAFLPFGQFGFNTGIISRKTDGFFYGGSGGSSYKDTYDGKSSGGFFADIAFLLGVTKMLGKNTGLDLQLGYNFYYTKNTVKLVTLHDDGIDGSIDETRPKETVSKFTNNRFIIGLGFQVFLDAKNK